MSKYVFIRVLIQSVTHSVSLSFIHSPIKIKDKFHSRTDHDGTEGEYKYSSTRSLTSALDRSRWLSPQHGRFFSSERNPVPIEQEAGLAPGPVWKDVEKLVRTPASTR